MLQPIIFLNSHPIQYFVPLYQQLAKDPDFSLMVLYCSDETINGATDQQFGVKVHWDIPLLQEYNFKFLRNYSFKPSIFKGFWGLMNWGIINYLRKAPKSYLIVHGWASFSHILAIVFGKMFGHTICLRAETPLNQEILKNVFIRALKNCWLRFLFLFIDKFLFIGKQNKLFYQSLGVSVSNLIFIPYAVDNKRFQTVAAQNNKASAREYLKLATDKKIILFSGKYIDKKRPLDLLQAFNGLQENCFLVMVGEGELKPQMQQYILENNLTDSVLLTGFINQSRIPFYYAAADFFVMCSGLGETWGLSINEAMNFKLPIIVSEICGSSFDLVEENLNGFVFETGNIIDLKKKLIKLSSLSDEKIKSMGEASLAKVDQFSYDSIILSLRQMIKPNI